MESRTKNSVKNIIYAVVGQVFGLLASFILRIIFVHTLSKDYLGVDSLFMSIVSALSLTELGIGSAINYSLYKPLAENDVEQIKALMKLYKRAYIFIGIVVFAVGVLLVPTLPFFVHRGNIHHLDLIFILFIINSSISYFYSYKKSLIVADQYRHITVVYTYASFVIMSIIQGILLVVTRNYVVYLLVMIFFTFVQNFLISKKADKMYPYLLEKDTKKLDSKTLKLIAKNTYAMSLHKIGGTVVTSTDNIVISRFSGIVEVGKYSNYQMVTNALNIVFGQIFNSVIASVGNLGAETTGKLKDNFEKVFFLSFWLISFVSCCLYMVFNPFIRIWVGSVFVLKESVLIAIVLNFYIYQMRRPVLTYRDALGIYWYDRFLPLIEAVVNVGFSIILAKHLGILGTLLGTIISMTCLNLWIEPLILYRYGLRSSVFEYYKVFIKYTVTAVVSVVVIRLISIFVLWNVSNVLLQIVVNIILSVFLYNVLFMVFYHKDAAFDYMIGLLKRIVCGMTARRES